MFSQTITHLEAVYGPITQAEIDAAMQEMLSWAGKHHTAIGKPVYLSENDKIAEVQARCWALSRRVSGKVSHAKPDSGDSIKRRKIYKELEACRLLMGKESALSNISLTQMPESTKSTVLKWVEHDFSKSKKLHCLLLGTCGSGKTYAAVGYVAKHSQVIQSVSGAKRINAKFITAYKVADLLNRRDYQSLDPLESVKHLIIDDLGAERGGFIGADFIAFFENLFNTRYTYGLPTLITSNARLEQIAESYGERFVSRFRESGEIFITSDPDFRSAA